LRALWIGEKPVVFSGGSTLDSDLRALTVQSLEVRLPFGSGESVSVRVELTNGETYEGQMTTKMPRDVGSRGNPTVHVYEFSARAPLTLVN
jgi:hypothetical protein